MGRIAISARRRGFPAEAPLGWRAVGPGRLAACRRLLLCVIRGLTKTLIGMIFHQTPVFILTMIVVLPAVTRVHDIALTLPRLMGSVRA